MGRKLAGWRGEREILETIGGGPLRFSQGSEVGLSTLSVQGSGEAMEVDAVAGHLMAKIEAHANLSDREAPGVECCAHTFFQTSG